ncbi:diaminopimelate epimerase, partial [candidate division FCPU426 bacterium]|nr:diaminopimelate epimerase [candidate division FCPU426 bacterium]
MECIRFAKMTGAANDFIVLDNRAGTLRPLPPGTIRKLCARRFAVGADGFMIMSAAAAADF